MRKRHATDYVDEPDTTLCGDALEGNTIDNTDPTCGRCLRIITIKSAAYYAKLERDKARK